MVSSRKEANVQKAVERIRQEVEGGGKVEGVVCHVGKSEHRVNLVKEVSGDFFVLSVLWFRRIFNLCSGIFFCLFAHSLIAKFSMPSLKKHLGHAV